MTRNDAVGAVAEAVAEVWGVEVDDKHTQRATKCVESAISHMESIGWGTPEEGDEYQARPVLWLHVVAQATTMMVGG